MDLSKHMLFQNAKEEWTDQAVRDSKEWKEIRDLAARALNAFGWPMEIPPSYSHEYVSGRRIQTRSQN